MAVYRSDQATVTFSPEVGQGGYMELGPSGTNLGTVGIATAVSPGDRTITLTHVFNPGSGANLITFIIVGNNTTVTGGTKEIRRVLHGFGTTTVTVDVPFGFRHPVVSAAANIIQYINTTADGTADTSAIATDDKGKFITWLPGVYESVDCPDPEQAFEPRYTLGSLTNRNFYQMYAGNESLSGSIGGMVMLNGFPLRFPIGKVVTTPFNAPSDSGWNLKGDHKAGDTLINIDRTGATTIGVDTYMLLGVPGGGSAPSGAVHQTDSTKVYEIVKIVTAVSSSDDTTMQIWPPLKFDHPDDEDLFTITVASTQMFLHTIFEQVALTPITWNVNIVDDAGTNEWQRRYVGGKVGSMSLSAEAGGLLTGGWDGVNFLDMVHNMKAHPDLPGNQPLPRYTAMQNITSSKVGRYSSGSAFDRPTSAPYYYSQGSVKMFGVTSTTEAELARIASFSLSISNNTEPKYYVGTQHDGRRAPKEQYEGNREYSMSASLATNDSADQGTDDTRNLFKELLLAGDYRGSGATSVTQGFRGFGIELKFVRDLEASSVDYIILDIPGDGTAAAGGNEQGAFIRTAAHNIGDTNPLTADADIAFRSMRIKIRDYEPIYP